MTKIKVLDLAREVGMEDEKLLLKLRRMGVKVKDKKPAEAEKQVSQTDEKIIGRDAEREIVEKRVKPTVIRRRTRSLETKPEVPPPPPVEVEPIATMEVTEEKFEEKLREKVAPEIKVPKEAAKTPKPPEKAARMVKGRKKTETAIEETPLPTEAKREEKVVIPPKPTAEAAPHRVLPKEEKKVEPRPGMEEAKPKEAPIKKPDIKLPSKEQLLEEERLAALSGKKKGLVKKRRLVEERMLGDEEIEGESRPEKEVEVAPRSFRSMKKKVVLKTAKKTEVTVPKPIKRIIRIAEVITVADLAKRMGVKGGDLIKKLMETGVLVNINQVIDADVASLVASEFGSFTTRRIRSPR